MAPESINNRAEPVLGPQSLESERNLARKQEVAFTTKGKFHAENNFSSFSKLWNDSLTPKTLGARRNGQEVLLWIHHLHPDLHVQSLSTKTLCHTKKNITKLVCLCYSLIICVEEEFHLCFIVTLLSVKLSHRIDAELLLLKSGPKCTRERR